MKTAVKSLLILALALVVLAIAPDTRAATSLSGCLAGQMVTQNASGGPLICLKGGNLTLAARLVDIATTGDQGLLAIPAGITKYQIVSAQISNCTVIPVLAQPQINTLAAVAGTSVVDPATITGATTAGIILPRTLTATATTNAFIATSLFVNLSVANVAAGTCDFYVTIRDLT